MVAHLIALPAYSRLQRRRSRLGLAREEVTANECLGTKAKVQER